MFKKLFAKKALPQVTLQPGGQQFEVPRNHTVLETALSLGLAYPHDCTVGTCGRCRSRLVSGKVDAITPFGYTLSREELAAGYILACQAVPESDLVLEIALGTDGPAAQDVAGRIVETRALTHDICKVTWEVSAPIAYRAGQYLNLTWPGGPGTRSYSFSAAPAEGGTTRLSTFIRKVPGGAFTERLFANAFADTAFTISAPHGDFWLREGEGPIILIGGGSGLAPLMSVLEDAVARGVKRDAVLLFGGRGERDLYCQDEITAIAARWQGRFRFIPVLSDEVSPAYAHGLVTGEIPAALTELGGTGGLQAYLCGPPGMIDAAIATLATQGVDLGQIYYDKFTDAGTGKV